jgi:hypothetical protein
MQKSHPYFEQRFRLAGVILVVRQRLGEFPATQRWL